jgi:hypothetical protein
MRTFAISLGILGGVFLVGSARADQPGDAPKPQSAAKDSLTAGEYVGRLVSVNAKGNELILQIATQRQVLKNPDGPTRTADQIVQDVSKDISKIGLLDRNAVGGRSLAEYQRNQAAQAKAVAEFQKALPKQCDQLLQQQQNPQAVEYITLTEQKDVPLTTAKEVKIRIRDLPTIDEDGHVRLNYSAEELRVLMGKDPDRPGYDGKLSNLKKGDYVRVTLAPKSTDKKDENAAQKPLTEVTAVVVISKEQAEKLQAARP